MNKTWKIIYYVTTVILSLAFLYGGYTEITKQEMGVELFKHLGYPMYLLCILGVAKILGVIGIWQKWSPLLREWAYAGLFIDVAGAIASHISVGDGIKIFAPAIGFIILIVLSRVGLAKMSKVGELEQARR